ncbi:MAG TPA: O-antigen ligase family protein [Chloroflexota bacterium]|nr:O-antigen ligase family protein [Chloroflexota bacterium]
MQLINTRPTAVFPGGLVAWGIGLVVLAGLVYWSPLIAGLVMVLIAGGAVAARLAWRHPELGLLLMTFLVADIISGDDIAISLGGFRVHPDDLALIGVIALFVCWGLRQQRLVISHWSFVGPLVALAGFAVFSALYALVYQHVDPVLIMGELRPPLYAVGAVVAAMLIVRRDQLLILLAGLFVIADLTAGAIIVHQFTGVPPSLGNVPPSGVWQVETMTDLGGGFGSVRVVPPAHVLLYLMENIAGCLVLFPPRIRWARSALLAQCALLGVALLLTYTRAQWVATAIALTLIVGLLPRAARKTLGRSLSVAVPVIVVALSLVAGGVIGTGEGGTVQALASRATSIITPNSTLNTASLQWRAFENQAAFNAIAAHPVVGVGLGNDYRDVTLLQGEASGWLWDLGGPSRLTRMAHNSYLYLTVKMGIPALLTFFWFAIAFLIGGARAYARLPAGPEKLVVLATVASFPGLLFWAIFEAHLMRQGGMVAIGLMVGIVVAIASLAGRNGSPTRLSNEPPRSETSR